MKRDAPRAKLLDVRRSNDEISASAAKEFASWPERVKAADGGDILLKSPEGGSIGKRVKHLIWDDDRNQLHKGKAGWMPNVPATLENADARLRDPGTSNRIYVRGYEDGTRHMVLVRPDGTIEDQRPLTGSLITQFPGHEHSRQAGFPVEWEKAGGQSQGTPAAASTGSTRLDARPSVSDGLKPPSPKGDDGTLPPLASDVKHTASDVQPPEGGISAKRREFLERVGYAE